MPSSSLSWQQGRAGRSPANSFLTSAANEMADYLQEGYYPPPLPLESNAPPGRSSRHISSPLTMFVMPEMRMIEAVRAAITEEMERDERVLVMGEDVGRKGGVFGATDGLFARFGESRGLGTPLPESAIVGVAIGAALNGLIPIAEIQFADFIHPAFDQIVSEAARTRYRSNGDWSVPIVIRTPFAGGVHGGLHHSQSIEPFYATVPPLKVVVPSMPAHAHGLFETANRRPDPVLFLEHKHV